MVKAPASRTSAQKPVKKSRAAKRPRAAVAKKKASKQKGSKKKAAKKSVAKKVAKKSAAKKKVARRAAKKVTPKSVGKSRKASVKKNVATKAGRSGAKRKTTTRASSNFAAARIKPKSATNSKAAKPNMSRLTSARTVKLAPAAVSLNPRLPAPRALTAGVVLRPALGARPRLDRNSGTTGRTIRKVNLRTGQVRPHTGKRVAGSRPAGPWPALDEGASETGLRERILVYVLAVESGFAGRTQDDSSPDPETVALCLSQVWRWLHPPTLLRDGRLLSPLLLEALVADEMSMLRETIGPKAYDEGHFGRAREQFLKKTLADLAPNGEI